jgi:hypothetical protein
MNLKACILSEVGRKTAVKLYSEKKLNLNVLMELLVIWEKYGGNGISLDKPKTIMNVL